MQKEKQDIIVAILVASLFVSLFGFISFLVVVNYVKRRKKLLFKEHLRESNFQQALLQAQLEMQEHTFNTVSRDIHDNVGQILSLVNLNLNILGFGEVNNEILTNTKDLLRNAVAELRELGSVYYADRLVEEGLVASLRRQLNQLEKTRMFTTSFSSELDNISIDKNKTIFLHRMLQEVLNNVVKHSGANHVRVTIFKKEGEIHITIEDNGKGFAKADAAFIPGIGLNSIQQRATMIGARVIILSEPGSGTNVTFVFK